MQLCNRQRRMSTFEGNGGLAGKRTVGRLTQMVSAPLQSTRPHAGRLHPAAVKTTGQDKLLVKTSERVAAVAHNCDAVDRFERRRLLARFETRLSSWVSVLQVMSKRISSSDHHFCYETLQLDCFCALHTDKMTGILRAVSEEVMLKTKKNSAQTHAIAIKCARSTDLAEISSSRNGGYESTRLQVCRPTCCQSKPFLRYH